MRRAKTNACKLMDTREKPIPQALPARDLGRLERSVDDVAQIARKICRRDAPQRGLGAPTTHRLERPPRAERGCQPCGHLRVFLIEFEQDVGDEFEARSVRPIELRGIALGKAADQRTYAVRVR